jgi:hypothetical protein
MGLPLRVGTTVAARSGRGRSRSSASTTSSFSPPATQPSRSATQAGGKRDRSSILAYPDHDDQSPHRRASTPAEAHACVTAAGCCLTSARSISTLHSSGSSAPIATRSCSRLHPAPAHGCHICTGTGPTLPHLHNAATSAHRCHVCTPLPHLHRDWARPSHICAATGLAHFHICAATDLAHSTSAPGLGRSPEPAPPRLTGTECLRPHCLALPRVRLPARARTPAAAAHTSTPASC